MTLLDVRHVWTVTADELLGKLLTLVESFGSDFDAVLQVVKLVLQDLVKEMDINLPISEDFLPAKDLPINVHNHGRSLPS